MAKRKRLSPANAAFLADPPALPERPRAAPIAEVAGEVTAHAALEEVAGTLARARDEGRMVLSLPLEAIDQTYLVRDRLPTEDEDMAALVESLRSRGQQTPIEVAPLPQGGYGLISGWRRCVALARLRAETGEARFAEVLALVRRPDQASAAYLAMVEENEIRVGLSFYERARIVARTVEAGVYESQGEALRALFASASRAKRSKIGTFIGIVTALDGVLRFPKALGERVGLRLAKELEADAGLAERLGRALEAACPETAETEQAVILRVLAGDSPGGKENAAPEPEEIVPGLRCRPGRGGRLTLEGPALDDALRDRLLSWLKRELQG
ncbi:ParB N-terminal domain-containing protein [Pseudoponticoccus marisrubri]|uniref:ParB-like N-terminal domain-containing protein n=1 Tax=Pseudoponticoccus marisrubri TaxID=1685382 RepID=A0A0W7WED4_9RHOB|nr:ParB N-terminal domain-containing protein [Pseudoponticoccus marisrubri]KUF08954.1 hypothetical protein AVJ23_19890 [Pseudoponticoccus marisrubri]